MLPARREALSTSLLVGRQTAASMCLEILREDTWVIVRYLDGRDARGASHKDDLIDVRDGQVGVLERLLDRDPAAVQQVGRQLLKLGARQVGLNVLGAVSRRSDEGQRDGRLQGMTVLLSSRPMKTRTNTDGAFVTVSSPHAMYRSHARC